MKIEALVNGEIHHRNRALEAPMTVREEELSVLLALAAVAAAAGRSDEVARRCVDFVLQLRAE